MCSHEACASNTRSRGASKTRVMTISRSDGVVTVIWLLSLAPIALLLSSSLELLQVLVQPVVALLPEAPVPLGPLGDLLERSRLDLGGLEEDSIARADDLDGAAAPLCQTDALGDVDGLTVRVRVPGRSRARREVDAARAQSRAV